MRRTHGLSCALAVVALAAAITDPLGAHAADGDNDVVVFTGHAGTTVPVPLIGGSGIGFDFHQTLCETASTDSAGSFAEAGGCLVTQLNGIINSIVCGTGTGVGFFDIQEPEGTGTQVAFAFAMIAGIGVMSGGDADGVFLLTPDAPNTGTPDCGQDFLLETVALTD